MSDFDPDLDELVSAYVDGEATADEVARVESDPELAARAARYRSLSARIGEVTPPSDDVRDAHLARALREHASGVGSLAAARAARRPSPRTWRIASIAAAVAVVFIAIPLLFSGGDGDADLASGDAGGDGGSIEAAPKDPDAGAQSQPSPAADVADAGRGADAFDDADDSREDGDDGGGDDGGAAADDGGDAATEAAATLDTAYLERAEEAGIEIENQNGFFDDALPPTCADDLGAVVFAGLLDGEPIVGIQRIDDTAGVYRVEDCVLVVDLPAP